MSEKSSFSRERKFFSKAAAIIVLGAGALSACSLSTEVVQGTPQAAIEVEQPGTQANKVSVHALDLDEILQPTEVAPRSPKNDTSRCVFAASQEAIVTFMHDQNVVVNHETPTQTVYTNPKGSEGRYYSIVVTTDTPGSARISFDATLSRSSPSPDGSLPYGYSLRGELTIPVSGSVDESLAAANPVNLREDYTIAERSAVFNLENNTGEVISKSYSDDVAMVNCQNAVGFIKVLS